MAVLKGNQSKKPGTKGAPGTRSVKMDSDEFKEIVADAVKSALSGGGQKNSEEDAFKGRKDGGAVDVGEIIEEALGLVAEKRKSRKDAGEELGEITQDEIMEAVGDVLAAIEDDYKEDDGDGEEKDDGGDPEDRDDDEGEGEKRRKSRPITLQVKSDVRRSPIQRKYAGIFLSGSGTGGAGSTQQKQIPPIIQLARAIKCLDVFGRHDPEAAAYHASKKYADDEMARQFKALNATNPTSGGYLIPEIYLDQIIEMLYSKTVIFELGAQKVPMTNGNLNIPKMTAGARATWGGEARKVAKSQPAYGNIKLSAKRLEAIVPQTRELLMSTNFSADQMFANDLTRRMELGLDYGAMFGTGGEFQPTGVTVHKEVEKVDAKNMNNTDLADNTGKITADFPVHVRSKVLAKNVDDQALGWTFNSMTEGYLMNMKTTTGAYIYREEMQNGKLLGFKYGISNQIPTTEAGLTEMLFGNWNDLLVGEQLGLETYTTLDGSWTDEDGVQHNAFEENLAATRALMYVDIAARHAESFLHCKNIKVV